MTAKFFKVAIANLLRYGTRTLLTAAGLSLAIAAVLFVNVVSLSFESGTANVYRYVRSTSNGVANIWVTPPTGFKLDSKTGFFTATSTFSEGTADAVLKANGSQGLKVLTGQWPGTAATPLVVYGRSDRNSVSISQSAAAALGVKRGEALKLKQGSVNVAQIAQVPDLAASGVIELPLAMAQQLLELPNQVSWVMLHTQDLQALQQALTAQINALFTTDPTTSDPNRPVIAYVLEGKLGRSDLVSFDIKLAALYFNQAGSTLLGWLARITLGLGFILMLSAALLSIEERRREFGIFAAVGVSSDVFYLFLLESLILFVGSTLAGLLLGALLLRLLTPALFAWDVILKSSVLVICYLPPMVIFGSLVPAQTLLQKSPLELLRGAT